MPFTNEEAFDMLRIYFQCFENAAIASRQYALRYPLRRHHSRMVFRRLALRLRQHGQVQPTPTLRRNRRVRREDNIINVLAYIHADPHLSIREISRDLGISYGSVQKILMDFKMHPYHIVIHQALNDTDFERRLDYCYWLRDFIRENHHILSQILWTDEASFCSNGRVNLHNMHYWSDTNPHWLREDYQQGRWSVNVWCGVINGAIIGPHIFNGNLTGDMYLNFLFNDLPGLLENVPLEVRRNMWFQQDGCPAHYSRNVQDFLNRHFPNRWIGRGSLFFWPPRSPDLTCLDFYLWGRIKDLVYKTRPTTREDMIVRIQNAINIIPRAEIEAAVNSTLKRLDQCVQNNGQHFEHLRQNY